jgi:hypothetical protein
MKADVADHPIFALAVYEDPNDPNDPCDPYPLLYAGGATDFLKYVYDPGSEKRTWVLADTLWGNIHALLVFDDGEEGAPPLYAGGWHPPPMEAWYHLCRWNGAWAPNMPGPSDHVLSLGVFDDRLGPRPALYAGGHFFGATDPGPTSVDSEHIARWGCACRGDLNHDGTVDMGDINPLVAAITNPATYAA